MGDAAGAKCLTGYLTLTKEKRNHYVRYVKPDNKRSRRNHERKQEQDHPRGDSNHLCAPRSGAHQ